MFFLVGGVQPKTMTLDDTARLCSACGLAQARLRRVDHYLSIFFIPIFPVKRGEPVVICDRCGAVSSPNQGLGPSSMRFDKTNCSRCGYPLESTFQYCPNCGSRV
jgi:ribosomal protein L37E